VRIHGLALYSGVPGPVEDRCFLSFSGYDQLCFDRGTGGQASITRSVCTSGLTFCGSALSFWVASRMAARSTIAGTPVVRVVAVDGTEVWGVVLTDAVLTCAFAAIAARRDFYEAIVIADYDIARAETAAAIDGRYAAAQVDASSADVVAALGRGHGITPVMDAGDPGFKGRRATGVRGFDRADQRRNRRGVGSALRRRSRAGDHDRDVASGCAFGRAYDPPQVLVHV